LDGLLRRNCGSWLGTRKSFDNCALTTVDSRPGTGDRLSRVRDLAKKGVDGAEQRMLIATRELVEALEAAQEPSVRRGTLNALRFAPPAVRPSGIDGARARLRLRL